MYVVVITLISVVLLTNMHCAMIQSLDDYIHGFKFRQTVHIEPLYMYSQKHIRLCKTVKIIQLILNRMHLAIEFEPYAPRFTLYPRRGCRETSERSLSEVSPRCPHFTIVGKPMTGDKPIAVCSQSLSYVSTISPLVAFYAIHGRKVELLLYSSVPDTTRLRV
jgi:hypothetical protein